MPLKPIQVAASLSTDNKISENKISSRSIVEYEQHSKPILGMAQQETKGKWAIVNQHGGELFLPASRLYLLPGKPPEPCRETSDCVRFLEELSTKAESEAEALCLEEVWQLLLGEIQETSIKEIAEMVFGQDDLLNHLAARRALLNDKIYFKRKKTGYEPRPEETVEQLKVQARVEQEKESKKAAFIAAVCERLKDPSKPLPSAISRLEQLAVLGKSAKDAGETRELLDEIVKIAGFPAQGKVEQRAFDLLVRMGHFTKNQNLTPIRLGRPLEFSEEALAEAQELSDSSPITNDSGRLDLQDLFTLTIDGDDTKDFDDALSLERLPGIIRVGVHITDVASTVTEGTALEEEALRRATSVYCPDQHLPMLPYSLSEGALSLIENSSRLALSFFADFDDNFRISNRRVERSIIKIDKRFTYDEVDRVLCDAPQGTPHRELLDTLWQAATNYEHQRADLGAVQFGRREMSVRLEPDGKIILERNNEDTPARKLVSELMILANETAALMAKDRGVALIFRSQEPPDTDLNQVGAELPEGPAREYLVRGQLKRSLVSTSPASHYGLGVKAYSQLTSPIRRASDLLNQRQLTYLLEHGVPRYDHDALSTQLALLEQGLEEAMVISRERTRFWLLKYLQQEKITELQAVIVRIDGPKPLAEIDVLYSLYPFIPANKQMSRQALGREIKLKIERINPRDQTLMLREIS